MDIQSLQDLEAVGAPAKIERLLDTTLPASRDPQLWKYASTYYVRRGMAGKSLEYYSGYLQSSIAGNRDRIGPLPDIADIDNTLGSDRNRITCALPEGFRVIRFRAAE